MFDDPDYHEENATEPLIPGAPSREAGPSDKTPAERRRNLSWFNFSMVFAMLIKIMTVFVIVPALSRISVLFKVPIGAALALPAVFEFGKLTGTIYFSILAQRMNLVKMINIHLDVYCGLCFGLLVFFTLVEPKPMWFWLFCVLFYALACTSIVTQWGLTVLKQVNRDKSLYKNMVALSGIAGAVMVAVFLLLGGLVVAYLGWLAPFVLLLIFAVIIRVAIALSSSPDVLATCEPIQSLEETAVGVAACNYLRNVRRLLTEPELSTFRGYLVTLGSVTAVNYSVVPTASTLYQGNQDLIPLGLRQLNPALSASILVAIGFGCSVPGRMLAMRLVGVWRIDLVVLIGTLILILGCTMLFGQTILLPASMVAFFGLGIVMASSKIGALLNVDDDLNTAAVSLMKIAQVLGSLLTTFVVAVTFDKTAFPLALVLTVLTSTGFFAYVYNIWIVASPEDRSASR